jgi:hypothetical protein
MILQAPEIVGSIELRPQLPILALGVERFAGDYVSCGLATFLAVEVKWNTVIELDAREDGTTVRVDNQGFADFGELASFQTRDQDW